MGASSGDPFQTPETLARGQWYGVPGYPTVNIDGKYQIIGASACATQQVTYDNYIQARLNETDGLSPISITGSLVLHENTGTGTVEATFELVDPGSYTNMRATLWVYDDNVYWCCGYGGVSIWDEVVRVLRTHYIDLTAVGQQVHLEDEFVLNASGPAWNLDDMHAVAVIQDNSGQKTVIQAARIEPPVDFAVDFPVHVAAVPEGSGQALFDGTIQNESTLSDVVSLDIGPDIGWVREFQIEGDPAWYNRFDLSMAPGETKGITVRVTTDANPAVGAADLDAQSMNTGRSEAEHLTVFNGSPSILLVEDDGPATTEDVPVETALSDLSYLQVTWDTYLIGVKPSAQDMIGYDTVIWLTGYLSVPVTEDDRAALKDYLDDGGELLLIGPDYLQGVIGADVFTSDYLGIDSWTSSPTPWPVNVLGVSGDPITDGMDFAIQGGTNPRLRIDRITPGVASPILISDQGYPAATRNMIPNGSRTVFSSLAVAGFSTTDPDPNNFQTFLGRSMSWLLTSPTSAPAPEAVAGLSGVTGIQPNPFHSSADVAFYVSSGDASGSVLLRIVDASGRHVRDLVDGKLPAGQNHVLWNGTDQRGRAVPSGIYFAVLKSQEGEASGKIVLTR